MGIGDWNMIITVYGFLSILISAFLFIKKKNLQSLRRMILTIRLRILEAEELYKADIPIIDDYDKLDNKAARHLLKLLKKFITAKKSFLNLPPAPAELFPDYVEYFDENGKRYPPRSRRRS